MSEKKNIEVLTIRLAPGEWEALCIVLKEDGYDQSSQGVHDFLFDSISEDADEDSETEDEDEPEESAKNPAFDALFDYLKKNPEAIKSAAGLGKSVFASLLKKKMGL